MDEGSEFPCINTSHHYYIILNFYLLASVIEPLYISFKNSRYDDDKVVWKGCLTQEDALGFCLDNTDDNERSMMEDIQDKLIDHPDKTIVHLSNPCHHGMIFSGYQIGKQCLLPALKYYFNPRHVCAARVTVIA